MGDALDNLIVNPDLKVVDALRVLDQGGQRILLVCDSNRRLEGVLTDGDFRRHLLSNKSLEISIFDIMNRDFISLGINERSKAHDILETSCLDHIPILDESGCVVELVTVAGFFKKNKNEFKNSVVIMAGGKGTRLSPLTKIIPKPLVPVGDKTMIEMIMDEFKRSGFKDFKVIVNYKKELIKSYFQENGLVEEVDFIDEEKFLGTAGGLRLLSGVIEDTFILSNCDVAAQINYLNLMDWHKEHAADLTILGVRKSFDVPYGVVNIDSDHYVTHVTEKPNYDFTIMSGIYVLEPSIFEYIPDNEFFGMDDLISSMISGGKRVSCYPIEDGWFDVGEFDEYKKLLKHFGVLSA